jgi:hypothetical protein
VSAQTLHGSCHCGNITFELTTSIDTSEIQARACGCDFCRMHGARNWSDPAGEARLDVKDPARLQRYLFGLKTADFYVCMTCGAYAGAVLEADDGCWSTVNLRLTSLDVDEGPTDFSAEDTAGRIARRRQVWTPTTVTGLP